MAKEKVVELEVKSNLEEVTEEIHGLKEGIDETTESVDNLSKSYDKFGKRTERTNKRVTSSFKKTKKEVSAFDKNLKGVTSTLKIGTSAISTYEGALGLVGVESDKVHEQLLNVQSAMALAQGVKGISDNVKAFKEWGIAAKAAAAAQAFFGMVTGATSGALKIFRIALVSTGIGAIVVAVGLLIANFDKVKKAITNTINKFKFLKVALKPLIFMFNLVKKGLEAIGLAGNDNAEQAKKQAKWAEEEAKREDERIQARLDGMKQEYDARSKLYDQEIKLAQLRGEDTEAMERKKYEDKIKQLKDLQAQEKKDFEDRAGYQRDFNEQQIKDKKEAIKVLKKLESDHYGHSVELTYEEQKLLRDAGVSRSDHVHSVLQEIELAEKKHTEFMEKNTKKYLKTTDDMVKSARNELSIWEAQKDAADLKEKRDKWKAWSKERLSQARRIRDLEIDLMADGREKELEQVREKHKREIEDLKGTVEEKKRLNDLYTEELRKSEQEINDKYRKIEADKVKNFFQFIADQTKKLWETYDEERDRLNDERIEKQDAQFDLEMELMKEGQEKEIQELVNSYNKKFEIAEGNAELEKELERQLGKDIEAIKAEYREKDRQATLASLQESFNMAKQSADAIQGLGDLVFQSKMRKAKKGSKEEEKLAKKQFQFNKAMQLSGAVIDAGKAIVASLASAPLAIGVAPNPVGIASLAMTTLTSAINIAKIASTKFGDKGSPDASGANLGAGGVVSPEFNIVGGNELEDLEGLGEQPLQAYVVSGDVTSAQSLDRNRVENATI